MYSKKKMDDSEKNKVNEKNKANEKNEEDEVIEENEEEILKKIKKENAEYINEFGDWLENKGLSKKTIKRHISDVNFYINFYLCYYEPLDCTSGCYELNGFLGDWFIRKALWSSCKTIKSTAASIKNFTHLCLKKKK